MQSSTYSDFIAQILQQQLTTFLRNKHVKKVATLNEAYFLAILITVCEQRHLIITNILHCI